MKPNCVIFYRRPSPQFHLSRVGEDGHTASLLPNSEALNKQVRWTVVTCRPDEEFSRVTLTVPLLNQAAVVVFLVVGRNKAKVLHSVLEETGHRPFIPAQLVRPLKGHPYWFVDREAACLLDLWNQNQSKKWPESGSSSIGHI